MKKAKLLPISAFNWATVTKYISYISCEAELQEINFDHVNSFPLGRLGPEKLLARKIRVLTAIKTNQKYLERFVGKYSGDLGKEELAVIRSMYSQYSNDVETIEGHLAVTKEFQRATQKAVEDVVRGKDDEFPF